MPLSQFADPTVAIEPPPQEGDFEMILAAQQAVADPFALTWMDPAPSSAPAPAPTKSWADVFGDVGKNFLRDLAGAVGAKVTGYNPNDPNQVAAAAAARAAQEKAEQQKLFLIVGGVGLAVVLGAMVMKRA